MVADAARRSFRDERRRIAYRLFRDASYATIDAMTEMGESAEQYLAHVDALADPSAALWAGGSLGRREMLPNSDLDLFVIYDGGPRPPFEILLPEFDQVEFGQVSYPSLLQILNRTFIDANQFIDGRPIRSSRMNVRLGESIAAANTLDRQTANLVSEYFYYHYFDFLEKRTAMGSNIKYSSGSSRVTLFFNFAHRLAGAAPPARRGSGPEFVDGLRLAEQLLQRPAPYQAIELVQIVKNAAITGFEATRDPRARYVSRYSLELIYEICSIRLRSVGLCTTDRFISVYFEARCEIEAYVRSLVSWLLLKHRASAVFQELASASSDKLSNLMLAAADELPTDAAAILAYGSWLLSVGDARPQAIATLAARLMDRPVCQVGGALMAIACCRTVPDAALADLARWTGQNRAGPYLAKLISRNPAASEHTRMSARRVYDELEQVRILR